MTEEEKEELLARWESFDRETRIRLSCQYLREMQLDEGQIGWLHFLASNCDE